MMLRSVGSVYKWMGDTGKAREVFEDLFERLNVLEKKLNLSKHE
jgi:hypothetical protein